MLKINLPKILKLPIFNELSYFSITYNKCIYLLGFQTYLLLYNHNLYVLGDFNLSKINFLPCIIFQKELKDPKLEGGRTMIPDLMIIFKYFLYILKIYFMKLHKKNF